MADEVGEKLVRVNVPALDEILGLKLNVLDKGFIRVVDYMGGDPSIVQAARVSYGKGTKKITEDEGLIRFLLRHSHTTPFEMCQLKIHVKVPMDCWRQWIRHRMSSTNEYSTRYSEAIDDKQVTAPDAWRLQSTTNKQGSSSGCVEEWPSRDAIGQLGIVAKNNGLTPGQHLSNQEAWFHREAAQLYQERLDFGVAKEVARKDLPLSTYTEAYWCIDLHNLMHFLSLRMDTHAQLEIRSFAVILGEIVGRWCPMAWAAFNDYNFRRHAMLLSRRDKAVINCISQNDKEEAIRQASEFGWMERRDDGTLKDNRERIEFEKKLHQLSMKCPWAN